MCVFESEEQKEEGKGTHKRAFVPASATVAADASR